MKERKLVLTKGKTKPPIQQMARVTLSEVKKMYPTAEVSIVDCSNAYYTDTYYDTETQTLRKNGESLKVRKGNDFGGKTLSRAIMRLKNKYPEKRKISSWYEVEVSVQNASLKNVKVVLKPFFPEFDFDELTEAPILICSTHRNSFLISIQINTTNVKFSLCFDSITYANSEKKGDDFIIKIHSKQCSNFVVRKILKKLRKHYPQYEVVYMSRYERALEVLKS